MGKKHLIRKLAACMLMILILASLVPSGQIAKAQTKVQYCQRTEKGDVIKSYSKEAFLKKFGCSRKQLLFQCKDQDQKVEVYYNQKSGKCCGIYYREDSMQGFAAKVYDMPPFAHNKYEINPEGKTSELKQLMLDSGAADVKVHKKKNKAGKLASYKITGVMEGEPLTLVDVEFTYNKAGTLIHKTGAYHPFVFSTSQSYVEYSYNKNGQLISEYRYITHGAVQRFYSYQSKKVKTPNYSVTLDFYGDFIDAGLDIKK